MTTESVEFDWIVLNQSQSPAFQRMLEHVSGDARGLLYTGTPFPSDNARFEVEKGPTYDRRSIARRAATWGAYVAAATHRVLRCSGKPFVLAVTNPPLMPYVAGALQKARGNRYGLLIWDIYPEHVIQLGLVERRSPIVRGWHALNRQVLARAEFVVTLGESMASTLRDELDTRTARIEVIPNWADTDEVKPIPKNQNAFAARHEQLGKLTVLYSGNMGASHGLDALLNAATLLRDDPTIGFVLIGDGLGRASVERTVEERQLRNVKILDRVSWETLPQSQAMGDVAIVSQARGTEHLSVPSKTYTALAVGSSILALTRDDSDLARLVKEHAVGHVHEPEDASGIADTLRKLATEPARLDAFRAAARKTAEGYYSARAIESRWKDLLAPFLPTRTA